MKIYLLLTAFAACILILLDEIILTDILKEQTTELASKAQLEMLKRKVLPLCKEI